MRIGLGSDHAGFALKAHLREVVTELGHEAIDFGTHSTESVDYPDIASVVAGAVARGEVEQAVLVCGTGVGMAIAANKVAGVRAAHASDGFTARLSRAHNDAQILTLGSRVVGAGLAEDLVRTFLATAFEGGRHARRIAKLESAPDAAGPS